jgi:hypothetical protein
MQVLFAHEGLTGAYSSQQALHGRLDRPLEEDEDLFQRIGPLRQLYIGAAQGPFAKIWRCRELVAEKNNLALDEGGNQ